MNEPTKTEIDKPEHLLWQLGNRGALGYGGRLVLVALVALGGDAIEAVSGVIRRALGHE